MTAKEKSVAKFRPLHSVLDHLDFENFKKKKF